MHKAFRQKTKIKKVHALHQTSVTAPNPEIAVVTWGVSYSLLQMQSVSAQPLIMNSDFKAFSKTSIHNHGCQHTSLPSKYSIKEYCPVVFRDLRERFGVDPDMYLSSLTAESAKELDAKRAGLFVTHDSEFLLQTLTRDEVGHFFGLFPNYHANIVERHAETLLPHYVGLFRVTVNDKDHYVMIQRNVYSYVEHMHVMYDLKGSTVDRDASSKELEKEVPMFKDNDFITREKRLGLDSKTREWIIKTVTKDAEFLASQKMMDYSLLVGLHNYEDHSLFELGRDAFVFARAQGHTESEGGADGQAQPPEQLYFLGIVKTLTKYGAQKMAAHKAKSLKHGARAEISTVNPEQYMQRFIKFVTAICSETPDSNH
eukprot:m.6566 g.6566  ORF g.6566 m.6566 type:complete len:371 (+) comp3551_c0_seq1:341-1453(+)